MQAFAIMSCTAQNAEEKCTTQQSAHKTRGIDSAKVTRSLSMGINLQYIDFELSCTQYHEPRSRLQTSVISLRCARTHIMKPGMVDKDYTECPPGEER